MGEEENCDHIWVSNSGQGGEPDYRKNSQMWSGGRMHVKCSECNVRTWMSKEEWEALEKGPKIIIGDEKRTMTDGSPVTDDHRDIKEDGQQKGYAVLSRSERDKGFVRPLRKSYVHEVCEGVTNMALSIAETYARQPDFYNGTFCFVCGAHFPTGVDGEFVWKNTDIKVGT